MQGILKDDYILIKNKKDAGRICGRGFGRQLSNGRAKLDLVEGAFLLERGKLKILNKEGEIDFQNLFDASVNKDPRFGHRYMVFRDLRKRGYKLTCGKDFDFSLSLRGDSGKGFVSVKSEREDFFIEEIRKLLNKIGHGDHLWTAVVDEETDITYYDISKIEPKGNVKGLESIHGKGLLIKDHILIFDKELAIKLLKEGFFGKTFGKGLLLSLIEGIYLSEKDMLQIFYNSKALSTKEFVEMALKHQPDIKDRYIVYKDLREKGLSVKTGFKYGTHFRAYEKDPHHHHSEYLIDVVRKDYKSTWSLVGRGIRLAHSVRKIYTFAVIDRNIEYISFKRFCP